MNVCKEPNNKAYISRAYIQLNLWSYEVEEAVQRGERQVMTEFGTVSMWLLPPVLGNKWVRRNSQAGTLVLTLLKRYKSVGVLNRGDTKMSSMFPSLRWWLRTGRPTHLSTWTTDETTYSLLLNLCFLKASEWATILFQTFLPKL